MNAQEASAFGALEDRIAHDANLLFQLRGQNGLLLNDNAVLRSALETADYRLAQAQTELEAERSHVKALQAQVAALQAKAAKWDSVPFNDIRRCLRDVDFDSEYGDRVFAWMKNATQDGAA